jgi:predicted nucleic acid-binding protein
LIYVDSSVVLAAVLAEDRAPSHSFWDEDGVASRLLEYEVMNRLQAYRADADHLAMARELIGGLILVELSPLVLARALDPFPTPVRTLDALHLATALYLTEQRTRLTLAT